MGHFHEDSDTYYPDQLCLIGFSAAFGAICLTLYISTQMANASQLNWQQQQIRQKANASATAVALAGSPVGASLNTALSQCYEEPVQPSKTSAIPMLNLLLAEQFHRFVLLSGIFLVGLALVRGVVVWRQAGQLRHHHHHDHEHSHDHHAHDHDHSDHDHHYAHDHDHGEHDHHHAHDHDHGHSHDDEHDHDHDHGWAPWRYIVLLIPVILFLLGLPNKGPTSEGKKVAFVQQPAEYASIPAASLQPIPQLGPLQAIIQVVAVQGLNHENLANVTPVDFKTLEQSAYDSDRNRARWKSKMVKVRGQYVPMGEQAFSLVRFRMQCCAADAVDVSIPVFSGQPLEGIDANEWVEVIGKVDFVPRDEKSNSFVTILRISGSKRVQPTTPDINPYIR